MIIGHSLRKGVSSFGTMPYQCFSFISDEQCPSFRCGFVTYSYLYRVIARIQSNRQSHKETMSCTYHRFYLQLWPAQTKRPRLTAIDNSAFKKASSLSKSSLEQNVSTPPR